MTKEVLNLGSAPNAGNGDPIRVAFQKVSNNFDYLYEFANSTSNTLTVVDGRIVLANSNAATLRADLTALTNSTTANVALLNSNVSTLAVTVATNLQTSKDHANAAAAGVQSNVASLATLVSLNANTATSGLNDLLSRITGTNAIVATLSATSSVLETRATLLENSVSDLTNTVSVIDGMLQHDVELDSAIDNLLARAGTTDNAIMGLQGSITSLAGSLSQNIADLGNQANATLTNLAALSQTSSQHTSDLVSLDSRIVSANANAAVLDARANTISNAVFVLDGRITNAVNDLATASGQIVVVQQSSDAVLAFANTVEDRVEVVENAVTLLTSNVASTFAITNANVATLAANTASTFLTANARMDAINATITSLAANSLGDAAVINARLNAAAAHANATNNPHAVTPAQIGAVPTSSVGVSGGIAELDGMGKLKYTQRPSYGYNDLITGQAQIDLIPANGALKLGANSTPWANVFTVGVVANAIQTSSLVSGGLSASASQVVVSAPLRLTNVGEEIITSNGYAFLSHPDPSSVQLSASNSVVMVSGAELDGNIDAQRADAIVAAQDDVILYSNLSAGWNNRKEIRFSKNGAITTSTFSLISTPGGLEFSAANFIITSDEIVLNTTKPFVVSGTELSYDGNAVLHLGNFDPATKVNVSDYSNAAVLAKLVTVDGSGSNLDADLLDGQHGAFYRDFVNQTNRPTTLDGYGITDAMRSNAAVNAAQLGGQSGSYYLNFANQINRPTTLDGYGITDAMRSNASVNAALLGGQAGSYYLDFTNQTNLPTTLAGYGITDAQGLSPKLTSLSGLSSNGVLLLTSNSITALTIGNSDITSLIDRQTGDVRYVPVTTANQANGYLKLDNAALVPTSLLSLVPTDIDGLSTILDDKVSKTDPGSAPVNVLDTTGSTAGDFVVNSNGVATWATIDYHNASTLVSGVLSSSVIPTTITHGLTLQGSLTHDGLTPSSGTAIDQILSVTDSITLSTSWQDTSINATDLATGTYIVQVFVNDIAAGGTINNEFYSGVMSWYSGDTNSATSEEVVLHRAGISPGGNSIFLRVARTLTAAVEDMKLQIASTHTDSGASNVVLKFRRML